MATKKKDFTQNNPALAFMSTETQEEARQEAEGNKIPQTIAPAPEGYKINPLYVETKTRRVQLLLQPSLVERTKKLAKAKGLSMNETVAEALREYLDREEK